MANTLQGKLDALRDGFHARAPTSVLDTIEVSIDALRNSELLALAAKAGETLPPFELRNHSGLTIRSVELLARGPLILTVFRGSWCPFCILELEALNEALPEIRSAGASLVAVTPELAERSTKMVAEKRLNFDVLSDPGLAYGERLGLVYTLPEPLKQVYLKLGVDLEAANGDSTWRLPVPARIVVVQDGKIFNAQVDPDYRRRPEPSATLALLRELSKVS